MLKRLLKEFINKKKDLFYTGGDLKKKYLKVNKKI